MQCVKCKAELPESPGPGRPPAYCGSACRRLVEFEIRRLDRRLARYEDELRQALADRTDFEDRLGRTRRQRINDARKWMAADEARLRELVGGIQNEATEIKREAETGPIATKGTAMKSNKSANGQA